MTFLEHKDCLHCGGSFPIHTPHARNAKWCSERCRRTQYTEVQACIDCGSPTSAGARNGFRAEPRCASCGAKRLSQEWAGYRQLIEAMWAEGMMVREINEALGTTLNISTLRARGYNLPHRRRVGPLAKRLASLERARAARVAA